MRPRHLADEYADLVIHRIRMLFSPETLCFAGLLWIYFRVIDRLGIFPPSLRWTDRDLYNRLVVVQIICVIAICVAVYAIGYRIRKKFNFVQLFSHDTRDEKEQNRVVELLRENPEITMWQLANKMCISAGHARDYFRVLKKAGRIEKINKRWIVKE